MNTDIHSLVSLVDSIKDETILFIVGGFLISFYVIARGVSLVIEFVKRS